MAEETNFEDMLDDALDQLRRELRGHGFDVKEIRLQPSVAGEWTYQVELRGNEENLAGTLTTR
jgi:hypothetical protein